jgi:hypothetical protein
MAVICGNLCGVNLTGAYLIGSKYRKLLNSCQTRGINLN